MRKLPKIISQEEFEELYKAVQKLNHKKKNQYKLAILLGFEAGLRISEIVGLGDRIKPLTKQMVDLKENKIRIESGKGQKDRIVPLPKRVNKTVLKLLPLTIKRRTLQHFITNLGKKVLKKHITFHTLRHGFGTHLAGQGRPLHEIQILMGHSRLDTTGLYLHANPKAAIEGARDVF